MGLKAAFKEKWLTFTNSHAIESSPALFQSLSMGLSPK